MKVCMITTSFPRWKGDGQGAFILELARALVRKGAQVLVIAMHTPGAAIYESIEGVKVLRPQYWWPEDKEMLRREGGGLPATLRRYPWISLQILPYIIAQTMTLLRHIQDYQIIHAHWSLSSLVGWLGKLLSQEPLPMVVTVHGSDIFQVTRYPLGATFTRLMLHQCNRVIAVSRALADEVIKLGVHHEKILVISNGVDIRRFEPLAPSHRQNVILYVGSLIERKGVNFLIDAMRDVFDVLPDYRLLIVGEGPLYPTLKHKTQSLNIASRVVFLGFQSQDQVRALMQQSKLLVLPSTEEAQGVVLLEALACGTPIVASRVGGIPEVVTPEVGILVPCADTGALTDAILAALSNSERWLSMSHEARLRAEKMYSWEKVASQVLAVYEETLGL